MPTRLPMTEVDIRSMARTYSRSMIAVLVSVARSKSAQPGARVAAANSVLERGWGKAPTTFNEGELDVRVTIRHILEHIDERPVVVDGNEVRCIDEDTTVICKTCGTWTSRHEFCELCGLTKQQVRDAMLVDASPVLPNADDVK